MISKEESEVPYSTIWRKFERNINGKITQFWVQNLPNEDEEKAVQYLCQYFARDEPLCRAIGVINDKQSMENMRQFWKFKIKEKLSLGCYTKLDNGENELVAVNCLVKKSSVGWEKVEGETLKLLFGILKYVHNLKNPFEILKLDSYLGGVGLVVLPEYRGQNIGLELFNAREHVCKALGLTCSITVFTSPPSQRQAEKAGFKDFVRVTFDEIEKNSPELKIPNVTNYTKCLRQMYKIYD